MKPIAKRIHANYLRTLNSYPGSRLYGHIIIMVVQTRKESNENMQHAIREVRKMRLYCNGGAWERGRRRNI